MNKIKLIFIIIWMCVIFLLSNQPSSESGDLSNSVINNTIVKVYKIIYGDISTQKKEEILEKYSIPVRKLAHFSIYFILGILSYFYFKDFSNNAFIYSLLLCFIYACTDEFHQYFVEGRYCSFFDVIIDTFGSFTSLLFFRLFSNLQTKKKSV